MVRLPVVTKLDVSDYGMYPGTASRPGLQVDFQPGMTLVLGANGLGKTTLINIIYRMLTGPADIPGLAAGGTVGNRRVESKRFANLWERRIFAARVVDEAQGALATLTFKLGDSSIEITRNLASLEITALSLDGHPLEEIDENAFEEIVLEYAGLVAFGDWILVLRLLNFYFEDRRAVVWDRSAQRQLLRLLFLPEEASRDWSDRYREILELDSLVRNLQYALNKEEKFVTKTEKALGAAPEIRQQIELLTSVQAHEQDELDRLEDDLAAAAENRQSARLAALSAEQDRESGARALERLQLRAIETAFPDASETTRYIIGHLLVDEHCSTCGTEVPEFAAELRRRLQDNKCPVCSSRMDVRHRPRGVATQRIAKAANDLEDLEARVKSLSARRADAELAFDELLVRTEELNRSISSRRRELGELIKRLPPDEQEVHKRKAGVDSDRFRLSEYKRRLDTFRASFEQVQNETNRVIAQNASRIKEAFDGYATGFLFEDCSLVWSVYQDRVGETGALISFPAFEVQMTGASFKSPVRRTGPLQVSESQREFIDLAFRMALMTVASEEGATIVVDAPESSLDAVFVSRAASVLTRFAVSRPLNRLVVTSNLIDGNLIPELLSRSKIRSERSRRIVDLLTIAAPTAATSAMHSEYVKLRKRIFERSREVRVAGRSNLR